jgi:hypothetical protein
MDWIRSNDELLWWLFVTSVVTFLMTPIVVGWLVVRVPTDYFTARRRRAPTWWHTYPRLRPVMLAAKNVLGIVLLLAGLVMLVIPGQGVLTMVVGLMLIDFPGKFRLERWLATRQPVWRSINWLRRRAGCAPLERPQVSQKS